MSKSKRYKMHVADANRHHSHPIFTAVRRLIGLASGKVKLVGEENLPSEPCVIVPNHAGAFGPICVIAHLKRKTRPFVISNLCKMKTAPDFARRDFFHPKSAVGRGVSRVLSYPIALILIGVFKGAECIPSYFDKNAVVTLAKSCDALKENMDLVIFPEERVYYSPYIEEYQRGFIAVARKYYKVTKKCISFVPTFCSASKKVMEFGKPIVFDPSKSYKEHCEEIRVYLRDTSDKLARDMGSDVEYHKEKY